MIEAIILLTLVSLASLVGGTWGTWFALGVISIVLARVCWRLP